MTDGGHRFNPNYIPQPYFIPGYTGYCPQMPWNIGRSYGQTTHKIMGDLPWVGGRLSALSWREAQKLQEEEEARKKQKVDAERAKKWEKEWNRGQPRLPDFAEGYTGHIPKNLRAQEELFNGRVMDSTVDFDLHGDKMDGMNLTLHPSQRTPEGTIVPPRMSRGLEPCDAAFLPCPNVPIMVHCSRCCPPQFVSPSKPCCGSCAQGRACEGSPPKKKWETRSPSWMKKDAVAQTPHRMRVPQTMIFREAGVIPNYTGFIPGFQFSFGETYGRASKRLLLNHQDMQRKGWN